MAARVRVPALAFHKSSCTCHLSPSTNHQSSARPVSHQLNNLALPLRAAVGRRRAKAEHGEAKAIHSTQLARKQSATAACVPAQGARPLSSRSCIRPPAPPVRAVSHNLSDLAQRAAQQLLASEHKALERGQNTSRVSTQTLIKPTAPEAS